MRTAVAARFAVASLMIVLSALVIVAFPAAARSAQSTVKAAPFSNEEWQAIVTELLNRGVILQADDAFKFQRPLQYLKQVFVEKQIPNPTPRQLFKLGKMLLHVDTVKLQSEKIQKTLYEMLYMANQMHMEVASREVLLSLDKDD